MSEPEEVIIDAAHYATETAHSLWTRHSAEKGPQSVRLEEIKRRLSLFSNAALQLDAPIVAAQPPIPPNFLVRWFKDIPAFNVRERPIASNDGARIRLPRQLEFDERGREGAMARYRLYLVEQALRILRGTARLAPDGRRNPTRQLFLLAEAVAVDRHLSEHLPGLTDEVERQRRLALEGRPERREMNRAESLLEALLRSVLRSAPADPPADVPLCESPEEALDWARRQTARLEQPDDFRGLPPVDLWGEVDVEYRPEAGSEEGRQAGGEPGQEQRSRQLDRRPRVREPDEDEDDEGEGSWFVPQDDLHETAQDPMGLQRPVDRDDQADPDELAESLAEMPEGRLVRTDDPAREVLASDDPPPRGFASEAAEEVDGIRYPEWDFRTSNYQPEKVLVRPRPTTLGRQRWVDDALADHAALIHEVRRCFEQLRPRRQRLRRQPDGDEIDLAAYVEAYGDRCAGRAPEDRLYRAIRPGRREVAVNLLIDVSASTDSWVRGDKRVVDVEKIALLLVCEALDALGDQYAITAFSGRGPSDVSIWELKGFEETYRREVKRRIGGLEPDRYTRCGGALRHATARLAAQSARHPLLLFLSDGKPNDVDAYEGRYGIEDTRQAVHEARLQGIEVFCLTIDREAPSYMNQIFGPSAYAVLRQPDILPRVLVKVVRRLLDR